MGTYTTGAYYAQESTGTLYECVGKAAPNIASVKILLENVHTLRTTSHTPAWCDKNLKFVRSPRKEGECLTDADLALASEWGTLGTAA